MAEATISIKHEQVILTTNYFHFTSRLEEVLNRIDPKYIANALGNRQTFETYLQRLQADTGLILFNIEDHGSILDLYGKPGNVKQYVIGNPLIAVQMTSYDVRCSIIGCAAANNRL